MMNKNINIIFVTDLHVESLGGGKGGRAFYNTLKLYIDAGWNISLITTGGGVPKEFLNNINVFEAHFPSPKNKWCFPIYVFEKWLYYKRSFSFYTNNIKSILDKNSSNTLIYAYEVGGVLAAKRASVKYNVPLVTRFQGTVHTHTKNTLINRLKYFPFLQSLGTTADVVIMTNDGTMGDKVLARLNNKTSKINFWMNGVSVPKEDELNERDQYREKFGFGNKIIYLTVSRLVSWKKVERALFAFSKVISSIPNAELHICGDGEERERLEQLSKSLNISQSVVFHGSIPHVDVSKYMMASDIFLSLYDLSNVGNPLLEAMSYGKSIITLDNGDTSRFIIDGKNGYCIPCSNLELIPTLMLSLALDSAKRIELGNKARLFAINNFWSWNDRMNEELKVVSNLIDYKA